MSLFDFGLNDGRKPANTTVSGYADNPYSSSDAARRSVLSQHGGQITDYETGIVGRNATEAYDKGVEQGMSEQQLSDLFNRLTR